MLELAIRTSDEPISPGQYRHTATHAWWMGTYLSGDEFCVHYSEHLLQQWTPVDPGEDWLLDRELTGRLQWLCGDGAAAVENGFLLADQWPTGRFRAPHGDFYAALHGHRPASKPGAWANPTAAFLAALPGDPDEMLRRLVADSPPGRGYTGPFQSAVDALRTCRVPAELRAVIYDALRRLPTVELGEATDLDGQVHPALVHDDGPLRSELLISPVDGQYAGERDTVRRPGRVGPPVGTVIAETAVSTSVVDVLGSPPGF
ncbi:hypothetical protein WIS52_09985 [Pseudonocardia nematodicida]|uniref:Uncharacterized protein n=1 Tax=Pseudonocardia nematodicida TaxID=1206997 RepID=A0ABV1K8J3_9PSEU